MQRTSFFLIVILSFIRCFLSSWFASMNRWSFRLNWTRWISFSDRSCSNFTFEQSIRCIGISCWCLFRGWTSNWNERKREERSVDLHRIEENWVMQGMKVMDDLVELSKWFRIPRWIVRRILPDDDFFLGKTNEDCRWRCFFCFRSTATRMCSSSSHRSNSECRWEKETKQEETVCNDSYQQIRPNFSHRSDSVMAQEHNPKIDEHWNNCYSIGIGIEMVWKDYFQCLRQDLYLNPQCVEWRWRREE